MLAEVKVIKHAKEDDKNTGNTHKSESYILRHQNGTLEPKTINKHTVVDNKHVNET